MNSAKKGWILAVLLVLISGTLAPADAGVDIHVGVGINVPPPAYTIAAPPAVALIPGTYVYFVPGIELDILFHHGYWYRPYEGRWYRSRHYNGPWRYIEVTRVPRSLTVLPPDYRHVPPGHQHIPYGHLKKNWSRWERDRYWDKHHEWKEERRQERREHRSDGPRRDEKRERRMKEGMEGHRGKDRY